MNVSGMSVLYNVKQKRSEEGEFIALCLSLQRSDMARV